MSRRHGGGHTLPDDPTWIEFPRSDGDPRELPKNTTKVVTEGQVNFMRPVDMDESLSVMWRVVVGKELASRMNLPGKYSVHLLRIQVLSDRPQRAPNTSSRSFPMDTSFTITIKAQRRHRDTIHISVVRSLTHENPYRHSSFAGSVSVNRFRSTNEFIPHALWLMQDTTMNRGNCQCKYCTKQPQRIISDTMGLSLHRSPSVAGPSIRRVRQPREPRAPRAPPQSRAPAFKPYAAVRRVPRLPKALPGPEQYMSPERDNDIRSSVPTSGGQQPRLFRRGELLWCALMPPIQGRQPEEDIHFWPGIVEGIRATAVVKKTGPMNGNEGNLDHLYAEAADGNTALGVPPGEPGAAGPSGLAATAPVEAEGSVPWHVEHVYAYEIKLLGVPGTFFVAESGVLPYLAHIPSDASVQRVKEELQTFMKTVPIDEMDRTVEGLVFDFDPRAPPQDSPEGAYERFKRAAAPYTLAIQIAANLANYWLPTDDWECKFTLPLAPSNTSISAPPPVSPPPPSQAVPNGLQTLHSIIQQSMANNASSPSTSQRPDGPAGEAESISMQIGRASCRERVCLYV